VNNGQGMLTLLPLLPVAAALQPNPNFLTRASTQVFEAPAVAEAEDVARKLWKTRDLFKTDVHAVIRCGSGEGLPRFKFSYMPIRNRGEIIRLILEEAQCSYELEVIGFEVWQNGLKATTPQGKLPVLRDNEHNIELGQEGAITRYLAQSLGLAGRTPAEQAEVDALYCLWFATMRNNGVSHDGENYSGAALKECSDGGHVQSLQRPRYEDMFRQNTLSRAERSLAVLRYFEERLAASSSSFLVGDAPTYVDLGLFYILFELAEDDNVPDFAETFGLPQLGAFLADFERRPHIRDYLMSPRRMPRYKRDSSGASLYTFTPGKFSAALS
jgi:glutathione S-transferase